MQFCRVKFIDLAFRLGVIFAIFGFIWGLFNFLYSLIRIGNQKSVGEVYLMKFIQYFLLVDVTFLFCIQGDNDTTLLFNELIEAGLFLVLYFVGKLQNQQRKSALFQLKTGGNLPKFESVFNQKAEILVISASVVAFIGFILFPEYARNPISNWFYESILDIETTPIFGFIFKIIGFFVLLGILTKIVSSFTFLLAGAPKEKPNHTDKNEDEFDDFEELK